ncbi:hypothetical protein WJX72_009408 [[Myrmecia] bisecta]|uniref:Fe2OG dioxygenase domain-containing protein n=1 Tax=[Myrmecia] bisecta TaxID=41462 RepID=A0AAW1QSC4_9CHLO
MLATPCRGKKVRKGQSALLTVSNSPPVISLADYDKRKRQITDELRKAATTIGFFYISDHGVAQELIDRAFAANEEYCAQPEEAKDKLPVVRWDTRQLTGIERNYLPDGTLRESSIAKFDVHEDMQKAWPDKKYCPNYRQTTVEFMNALPPVANKILGCLALGLGLPENFFTETANPYRADNFTFLQYHKYPGLEGRTWKEGVNCVTAHTDESLITLLFAKSPGLELASGRDGKAATGDTYGCYQVDSWTPCPPIPGCFTVNIGDPLQYWSDGVLLSNYHRVRCPKPDEYQGDRYSI